MQLSSIEGQMRFLEAEQKRIREELGISDVK
jgi:hypothetical protein